MSLKTLQVELVIHIFKDFFGNIRKKEAEEVAKIKRVLEKMKCAAQRQTNVSKDIKVGLSEIEESIDSLEYEGKKWEVGKLKHKESLARSQKVLPTTPLNSNKRDVSVSP